MAFTLPLSPPLDRAVAIAASANGMSKNAYIRAVLIAAVSADPRLTPWLTADMRAHMPATVDA